MKMLYKKILITLLVVGLVFVAGCSSSVNNKISQSNNANTNDVNENIIKEEYNKELAELFPLKEGFTWYYQGIAEYGHVMTLKNITNKQDKLILNIEGYLDDAVEDPEPNGERTFKIKYIINKDSVKEEIIYNATGEKTFWATSIIPDMIILKAPIKVGTKWEQKFKYKGKEYTAITTITKIEKTDKRYMGMPIDEGQILYTTETIVKGIEGFKDKIYKETRTYIKGKGLVGFTKSLEMYRDEDGNLVDYGFDFGYDLGFFKDGSVNY